MSFMAFWLVVKKEIKILVKTKHAGNSPQIFPNWRLLPYT
jgi:hypothetical protein